MSSFFHPKLELKYCERCGGLWLRPQGGDAVYCAACSKVIQEFPPVKPRGGGPAVPEVAGPIAGIERGAVPGEGVWA